MKEATGGSPMRTAEILGGDVKIPEHYWTEPMFVGPQTIEAARQNRIVRAGIVRFRFRNYYVIDIVLGVRNNGWIAVMSGGYLNDPTRPLQFAKI